MLNPGEFSTGHQTTHPFAHRVVRENALHQIVDHEHVVAVLICLMERVSSSAEVPFATSITWDFLYLPGCQPHQCEDMLNLFGVHYN